MNNPPEILYTPDWKAIIAALALVLSLFNLWYAVFRRGRLSISASRWTAVGLEAAGKAAAAFAVKIDVINTGGRPILLKDLFLEAETQHGVRIYYDPIMLFDLTNYFGSLGQDRRIATAQKGMVPLPIRIPAGKQIDFGSEMLFLPHDKQTTVLVPNDFPITLRLFASIESRKRYQEISTQTVAPEDVASLTNGGVAGILSTTSIGQRSDFLTLRKQPADESDEPTR